MDGPRDVEMGESKLNAEGDARMGLSEHEWKFYQFVLSSAQGVKLTDRPNDMEVQEAYTAMNTLLKKNTLEVVVLNGENMLRAIDLKDAEKASRLNNDGRLIYNAIRAAGNVGIWTKDLKKKTNLHTIVLNSTLKRLEQKQEIKAVKHVKYPTRKIYMLYNLTPSSEVTGGAWYTDQELDTDFIDSLKAACLKYISARSFPRNESVRDAVFGVDYEHYPTATEVRRFITESRISSIDLSVKDITSLLDVLVYDGAVEKKLPFIAGMEDFSDDEDDDAAAPWAYKAIRKGADKLATEALTEVPCGRCPVFTFCTEDGPVSPFNCEYFKTWLDW
ncbi:34-kDa subunit of RNA polymerase III (C) [Apophysomyces sp. BC1034]|nr:34-kDa subunit of RNA polymerase III (C) [Apophysomyces sp. BC1015]KAG0177915.1 34-kDa subunit of RNA polymerase III (C) [Apophysomyces sp. BC1021]KAG0191087.1 34-kDa subunit of RNA polymerase III (C) [Apophysomyces sp. BC1034]